MDLDPVGFLVCAAAFIALLFFIFLLIYRRYLFRCTCPSCNGHGECAACGGTGKIGSDVVCYLCEGTGICFVCEGKGTY